MDRKILLLVGILVIAGGAAFAYFDPLELDLLGLKPGKVVVQPVAKPGAAVPAAGPGVAAPAAQAPAAVPKPAAAPAPVIAPAAPTSTAAPAATPDQAAQTPLKLSTSIKSAKTKSTSVEAAAMPDATVKTTSTKPGPRKPVFPKDADLRHCLELETDAAIAKCAGE